jgi:hypothetical protein
MDTAVGMITWGSTVVADRIRAAMLSRVIEGANAPATRASVVTVSITADSRRNLAPSASGTIATMPRA